MQGGVMTAPAVSVSFPPSSMTTVDSEPYLVNQAFHVRNRTCDSLLPLRRRAGRTPYLEPVSRPQRCRSRG